MCATIPMLRTRASFEGLGGLASGVLLGDGAAVDMKGRDYISNDSCVGPGAGGARQAGSSWRTEFTRVDTGRASRTPSGAGCNRPDEGAASQARASSGERTAGMRSWI